MPDEVKDTRDKRPGERLTWVLVGVLALIMVSLFVFEGAAQSTALVVSLILGLVGIVWSQVGRKPQ